MAKTTSKLTTRSVQATSTPGKYPDGNGLYLVVSTTGRKAWLYRFMLYGRAREMGLGTFPEIGLAEARDMALEARRLKATGVDPIEARKDAERTARRAREGAVTFQQAAEAYVDAHAPGWRNPKHVAQWKSTLEIYVYPHIGDVDVAVVDTDAVLSCLEPIWHRVPETASRVRGRIEAVIDSAKARGQRSAPNPAVWRGHLKSLLPAPRKVRKGRHQPSLPYPQIGEFMMALAERDGVGRYALEFIILTASRSTEVRLMPWGELEEEGLSWMRPEERMKSAVPHRVPLAPSARELLDQMARLQGHADAVEARKEASESLVFAGKRNRPVSDMTISAVIRRMNEPKVVWVDPMQGHRPVVPHGFRATFRTWVAEQTDYPRDLSEAALAHVEGSKTVASYQRGDLFEKRRKLMEEWASFISAPPQMASDQRRVA